MKMSRKQEIVLLLEPSIGPSGGTCPAGTCTDVAIWSLGNWENRTVRCLVVMGVSLRKTSPMQLGFRSWRLPVGAPILPILNMRYSRPASWGILLLDH